MKPIEAIWSDTDLACRNVRKPRKLSNHFLLDRFVSFVQWKEAQQIKTRNQTAAAFSGSRDNGGEFELENAEETRTWEVGQSIGECNLILIKAKVKVILPNDALRLLLSKS
jgi:hypothetical protein